MLGLHYKYTWLETVATTTNRNGTVVEKDIVSTTDLRGKPICLNRRLCQTCGRRYVPAGSHCNAYFWPCFNLSSRPSTQILMGQIVGTSDREASASDPRNDHLDRLIHEILKVPNGGDRDIFSMMLLGVRPYNNMSIKTYRQTIPADIYYYCLRNNEIFWPCDVLISNAQWPT